MSRLLALGATIGVAAAQPAAAQDHAMHGMKMMPGMTMPAATKAAARRPAAPAGKKPTASAGGTRATNAAVKRRAQSEASPRAVAKPMPMPMPSAPDAHQAMDHGSMPGMAMPGMAMPGMAMPDGAPDAAMADMAMTGTVLPAGDAAAPAVPMDHYADRFYPPAAMAEARAAMMREQGGQRFASVMVNLAEAQVRRGDDGYRWDGEAWFGGDIDRLVVKSEGSGGFSGGIDRAEVQALASRAIGPYFNLQAGIRQDIGTAPRRTYATIGVEGLAPYMFEVGGAAFLSDRGEVTARIEGYYDQRLTQRLILQPRIELNLSAQDAPSLRQGAGLVDAELGVRLRYEITRQIAPYIGISHDAKAGRSVRYARADGADPAITSLVAGMRLWF